MESQNSHPAARRQNMRKLVEKGIQHLKLTVYVNAQRLKGSCAGFLYCFFALFFRDKAESLFNEFPHFCGSVHLLTTADRTGDAAGNLLRIWLIGVFHQHPGQFFPVYFF